jgi:hypothetical protein
MKPFDYLKGCWMHADTARRCPNGAGSSGSVVPLRGFRPPPYGFGMKRLSLGNSLLLGGLNPVTTIKWIGGHLSLIAAANRRPSIEPGIFISVMTSSISRTLSSTSIASSASNVAMTLCPPLSKIPRKYSLIRNSSSTVKINIMSKQLFDNFVPRSLPSCWIT